MTESSQELTVEQRVIKIIAEQMGLADSEISRESRFLEDLNADSLDTVEFIMEAEDEFEISIPDSDAEGIVTVGQAIDHVKNVLAKGAPPVPSSPLRAPRTQPPPTLGESFSRE